jgi:eukaryotic-like serine/threonine-protein kinase
MDQAAQLDELLDRWEALREEGRTLSAEDLCAQHPGLLDLARRRIQAIQAMDWLDSPLADFPCPGRAERIAHALAAPSEFHTPPTLAGRYHLEQLIAQGGFGQVWRATDATLARTVAVKLTAVDCLHEARRVAQLKHQGIVSVHDVGRDAGLCFIVFDYVEGRDLAWQMAQRDFSWQEAAELVACVAEELQYAHQRGIIHRDIKPANILLDRQGHPLLADFGIAVTASEMASEVVTTAGTLAYMAPELLRADGQEPLADARTDIYSLGVVLYQLLTGRLPFAADTLWGLRARILDGGAVPADQQNPAVPAALAAICQRCLASCAEERYPSAAELAQALRGVCSAPR